MNAAQIIARLIAEEMDASNATDKRRVLLTERLTLQTAVQSGDLERIKCAMDEAVRVAKMWGVRIGDQS